MLRNFFLLASENSTLGERGSRDLRQQLLYRNLLRWREGDLVVDDSGTEGDILNPGRALGSLPITRCNHLANCGHH